MHLASVIVDQDVRGVKQRQQDESGSRARKQGNDVTRFCWVYSHEPSLYTFHRQDCVRAFHIAER